MSLQSFSKMQKKPMMVWFCTYLCSENTSWELMFSERVFSTTYFFCKNLKYKIKRNISKYKTKPPFVIFSAPNWQVRTNKLSNMKVKNCQFCILVRTKKLSNLKVKKNWQFCMLNIHTGQSSYSVAARVSSQYL